MAFAGPKKALLANVLRNLGHSVPDDDTLTEALKDAFRDLKESDGVDPMTVKYKVSFTPIDDAWVKDTF